MNNNQVSSAPKPTIAVYMDDTPAETSQLLPEDFVQEEIRNEGIIVATDEPLLQNTPQKKPRKITPKPSTWKSTLRKQKCQADESYVSVRGKLLSAKAVKSLKNCNNACKFKCSVNISDSER